MSRNPGERDPELQNHVVIGEIVKPHGIKGEIKAYLYSERPENFKQYNEIVLQEPTGSGTTIYNVVNSRQQGKLAILQLEGVTSREGAEALLGSKVWLKKSDLPEPEIGEYYWHQLKGLAVITGTGRELGRVTGLINTRAHDIMVVTGAGHEYMIPVKDEIIKEIDEQGGQIIIVPPPGLLEINE